MKWYLWVIANTLGCALGMFFGLMSSALVESYDLYILRAVMFTAIQGVTIAIAQWLVLRNWIKPGLWILATTASWCVFFWIIYPISFLALGIVLNIIPYPISVLLGFAVGGYLLGYVKGAFQWLILSNQVKRAKKWISINAMAIAISFPIVAMVAPNFPENDFFSMVAKSFVMGLFGLIDGMITGQVLVSLIDD